MFPHGFAGEFHAEGVVYEPITDGVCEGGVVHGFVLVCYGSLAGGNGYGEDRQITRVYVLRGGRQPQLLGIRMGICRSSFR